MSKHKKQHFVPRSYLSKWCDPNCSKNQTPYVWRFSVDGKEAKRKSPHNIFHETEMYTIRGVDGSRDLTLEQGLQQLESKFARIRRVFLDKRKELSEEEHLFLCVFIAATQARTKATRNHWKKNWEEPLLKMDKMMEWAKTATDEQIRKTSPHVTERADNTKQTISYEQVKALYEEPLQNLLPVMIEVTTPFLTQLKMVVFCTKKSPGFITSDYPCVWFDPDWHKKPPLYRSPCLSDPKLEITLPISPNQLVLLSRHDFQAQYLDVNDRIVNELNRRTRFDADEYFIVNRKKTNPYWFDPGNEPDDSWDNLHKN
jgi:hypothetical protein